MEKRKEKGERERELIELMLEGPASYVCQGPRGGLIRPSTHPPICNHVKTAKSVAKFIAKSNVAIRSQ